MSFTVSLKFWSLKETLIFYRNLKGEKEMKGIRGSTEFEKQFLSNFQRLCNRHHTWQVWQDFVHMSACAIANAVDRRPDIWNLREASYLAVVKRYSKDELNLICELFSITVMALDENPAQDFLGKIYMQLDFGSDWHGQFFTPWNVAELMAKMQIKDNLKEQIERKDYISINDPCCGAGCMFLAFAHVCKNDMNINYQQSVLFVGEDVDEVVAKMCYIQISLLGCPGYVVVGDTLLEPLCGSAIEPISKKPENIWFTPLYFTDLWTLRKIRSWNKDNHKVSEPVPTLKSVEPPKELVKEVTSEKSMVCKTLQKPVVKKSADKKKSFSWKEFFTVNGKK